jgi:acyl carrier protein
MSDHSLRETIKGLIVTALDLQIHPDEISDNEVIFGGGLGADSTATLEIIFAIEDEFQIEVSDEELRIELFDSVDSLTDYVSQKLESELIETGTE